MIAAKSAQDPESDDEDEDEISDDKDSDAGSADSAEEDASDDEEEDNELSGDSDSGNSETDERDAAAQLFAEAQAYERKEKRKRKQDDFHDLESKYFQKLADEEPSTNKRRKLPGDESKEEKYSSEAQTKEEDSDGDVPMHESLVDSKKDNELDKAARTVFLSNVSIEAVGSKRAKKTLLAHLSSILDKDASPAQTVESLRFRSVPFSSSAIPKRAAFITKATMEATTHSANAYAVYSTTASARTACKKLNGTVVLDRHLRVDSVAHPAEVDHRRCVFVGNLGFVDDETVLNVKMDEDGKEKTEKRKRTKVPMDVEEGLWRTFGQHAGKVESVRVVRDQTTRVGKGIAYVQFYVSIARKRATLIFTQENAFANANFTGWQLGRICLAAQRQEIPAHAAPRPARQPVQSTPQDSKGRGEEDGREGRRPEGQRERQEGPQVRAQADGGAADHGGPDRQAPRPLGSCQGPHLLQGWWWRWREEARREEGEARRGPAGRRQEGPPPGCFVVGAEEARGVHF